MRNDVAVDILLTLQALVEAIESQTEQLVTMTRVMAVK